jgi:hypothetical protein
MPLTDPMRVAVLVFVALALAAIYGVPYLLALRRKGDSAAWPASSKPPRGAAEYIAEVRRRMQGVRYVEILQALEEGVTPDEASQRAAVAFHDMYITGQKPKEGEAAQ